MEKNNLTGGSFSPSEKLHWIHLVYLTTLHIEKGWFCLFDPWRGFIVGEKKEKASSTELRLTNFCVRLTKNMPSPTYTNKLHTALMHLLKAKHLFPKTENFAIPSEDFLRRVFLRVCKYVILWLIYELWFQEQHLFVNSAKYFINTTKSSSLV